MSEKEYILSINPCIYGLNYHDPCAAIISNGEILFAVEEERVNGIKGSKGLFPEKAICLCLKYCNLCWDDITKISVGYDPKLWKGRLTLELLNIFSKSTNEELISNILIQGESIVKEIKKSNLIDRYSFFDSEEQIKSLIVERCKCNKNIDVDFYEHHLAHIASSYCLSGFDSAVGVVVDGIGEYSCSSIWEINNYHFKKIFELDYPNSLGYFYAIATKFLGFKPWCHEGKTMALAPYGFYDQSIMSKLKNIIDITDKIYDVSLFIQENSDNFLMVDEEKALTSLEKTMGFSARKETDPITQQHKNFAWAVQHILETSVSNLIDYAIEKTGIPNVCTAGGVFMNCKMNMVLREKENVSNLFVQPLASDMGLVLGSGILSSVKKNKKQLKRLDFGPEYTDEEITNSLNCSCLNYNKCENLSLEVARLIADGQIVCWFDGRMEMGARALGHRSILADPRNPKMSIKINELIKHREVWRPFACSVLEEDCEQIFENYKVNTSYPFMIEAFKVKDEWLDKIPAVIHIADNTSRPQTVNASTNQSYYNLIKSFKEITGCPLILNTSFNDKGQPIIMTPQLAIDFFKRIPVDVLVLGNYIIKRVNNIGTFKTTN